MAYIHKRSNGKWAYTVSCGIEPLTKKPKQITKSSFATKKEATSAARKVEAEVENGTFLKETKMTFESFAKDWIKVYAQNTKISSVRARSKEMKHFISVWGPYPLKKVSKQIYQKRIMELSEKYSRNYVSGIHACCRMIFNHAVELGLIKINPTENTHLPKYQVKVEEIESKKEKIKFLEKEELAQFLRITDSNGLDMDSLIFTTLAYTGLRIGELLALKWTDFDEEKGSLRVTKTLYNPNNNIKGYELLTPKTSGSIRTIRIDERLVKMLKRHAIKQKEIKFQKGPLYVDNQFIFARDDGHPQLRKVIETRLKRLLKKADIDKNITPHSFRHTHTSLLIEAGVGVKEMQQRLGHTDINTTMNIYAHMTANMEEKASHQFSKLMKDLL
ncbi:tyrosine-type recombinase/integrase [Bacillus sp. EB600]|uniref:site-specific integrase n=1 Tax=Bacillus sp. EB600 TaxID=2806345 RepID=UPI0021088FB2|nr:tyrosine-type recombinase/integrase [Bacillus sp. EB600]MCQ6281594.1 site-specific integrase [Bacillus sp. EB600]